MELPAEVGPIRHDLDDSYLDTLQAAIAPPDGDLITRVFTYDPPDDGQHDPLTHKVAIWKVEIRADDVWLLIEEVRRLRAQTDRYAAALREIADADYRGPEPRDRVIARRALAESPQ